MINDHKPKTLKEKCVDWIERNVPVHSRYEMLRLMETNEALAVQLITAHLDLTAARERIRDLEKAVYSMVPSVPWAVHSDVSVNPHFRERVFSLRWSIDPCRQNVSIMDAEFLRGFVRLPEVVSALENHFNREVAPALFHRGKEALARALDRSGMQF